MEELMRIVRRFSLFWTKVDSQSLSVKQGYYPNIILNGIIMTTERSFPTNWVEQDYRCSVNNCDNKAGRVISAHLTDCFCLCEEHLPNKETIETLNIHSLPIWNCNEKQFQKFEELEEGNT